LLFNHTGFLYQRVFAGVISSMEKIIALKFEMGKLLFMADGVAINISFAI